MQDLFMERTQRQAPRLPSLESPVLLVPLRSLYSKKRGSSEHPRMNQSASLSNLEVVKPFTVRDRSDLNVQPRYPHVKLPRPDLTIERRAATHRYLVPLAMNSPKLSLPAAIRSESRLSDIVIPETYMDSVGSQYSEELPREDRLAEGRWQFREIKVPPVTSHLRDRNPLAQVNETKSENSDTARQHGASSVSPVTDPSPCPDDVEGGLLEDARHTPQLSTVRLVFSGQRARSQPHVTDVKAALVRHKQLQTHTRELKEPDLQASIQPPQPPQPPQASQPPQLPPYRTKAPEDLKVATSLLDDRPADLNEVYPYTSLFEDREILTSRSVDSKPSFPSKRTLLEEFIKQVIYKRIRTEADALTYIETQLNTGLLEDRTHSRKASSPYRDVPSTSYRRTPGDSRRTPGDNHRTLGEHRLISASVEFSDIGPNVPRIVKTMSSHQFELMNKSVVDRPVESRGTGLPAHLSSADLSLSFEYLPDQVLKPLSSSSSRNGIRLISKRPDSRQEEYDLFEIKATVPDLAQIELKDPEDSDHGSYEEVNKSFSHSQASVDARDLNSAQSQRKLLLSRETNRGLLSAQQDRKSSQQGVRPRKSSDLSKVSVKTHSTMISPQADAHPSIEVEEEADDALVDPSPSDKEEPRQTGKHLRVLITPKAGRLVKQKPTDLNPELLNKAKGETPTSVEAKLNETSQSLAESAHSPRMTPKYNEVSSLLPKDDLSRSRELTSRSRKPPSARHKSPAKGLTEQVLPGFVEELQTRPLVVQRYVDTTSNSTDKFIVNFARSLLKMISVRIIAKAPQFNLKSRKPNLFSDVAEEQKKKPSTVNRNRFSTRLVQKQIKVVKEDEEGEAVQGHLEQVDVLVPDVSDVKGPLHPLGNKSGVGPRELKKLAFSKQGEEGFIRRESALELITKYNKPKVRKDQSPLSSDDELYQDDSDDYTDSRPSGLDTMMTPMTKRLHDTNSQNFNYEIEKFSFMSKMANKILHNDEALANQAKKDTDQPDAANLPEAIKESEEPESASPSPEELAVEEKTENIEIMQILAEQYEGPDVKSQLELWFIEKELKNKGLVFSQPVPFKFSNQKDDGDKPFTEEDLMKDGIDLTNLQSHTMRTYFYEMRRYKPQDFANINAKDWKLKVMPSDFVSPLDKKMLRKDNLERRKLKMARLSQILHDVKSVTTMKRRPKKTFTNLDVQAVEQKLNLYKTEGKGKVPDVVLSGGANQVKSELELQERLYCRVKGEKNLTALGGGLSSSKSVRTLRTMKHCSSVIGSIV
jgi:hypothetical protein